MRVALGNAEAETTGKDKTFERLEIRKQDTIEIDTSAGAIGGVPLYERAAASGFVNGGSGKPTFSSRRNLYGYSDVPA